MGFLFVIVAVLELITSVAIFEVRREPSRVVLR